MHTEDDLTLFYESLGVSGEVSWEKIIYNLRPEDK